MKSLAHRGLNHQNCVILIRKNGFKSCCERMLKEKIVIWLYWVQPVVLILISDLCVFFISGRSSPNIGNFHGIKFAAQIICQHRPDAALGVGCLEGFKKLPVRHNRLDYGSDFKAGHCSSQGLDRVHWNTISMPPVGKSGGPCHKRQSHSPVFPNKQNSQSIFWRSNYPTISGYYTIINLYYDDQIYLPIWGRCWCKSCSWKLIGYPPAIRRNQGLTISVHVRPISAGGLANSASLGATWINYIISGGQVNVIINQYKLQKYIQILSTSATEATGRCPLQCKHSPSAQATLLLPSANCQGLRMPPWSGVLPLEAMPKRVAVPPANTERKSLHVALSKGIQFLDGMPQEMLATARSPVFVSSLE